MLGVAAVLAAAIVGGDPFGVREKVFGSAIPEPRPAAGGRDVTAGAAEDTVLRSHPWWQSVDRLEGSGPGSVTFTIDETAIQWRVVATCDEGELVILSSPDPDPLIEGACGARERVFGSG